MPRSPTSSPPPCSALPSAGEWVGWSWRVGGMDGVGEWVGGMDGVGGWVGRS